MATVEEPQVRVDEEHTAAVGVTAAGEIAIAIEEPARPPGRVPPGQWLRDNLFRSVGSSLLTVAFGAALAYIGFRLLRFAFVTAEWDVVRRNLRLFVVGRFPADELWRVWAAVFTLGAATGFVIGVGAAAAADLAQAQGRLPERTSPLALVRRYWPLIMVIAVGIGFTRTVLPGLLLVGAVALLLGGRLVGVRARKLAKLVWLIVLVAVIGSVQVVSAFGGVAWDRWGGLLVTLFVTVAGITFATPLGIALALGRRSSLPALRWVAVSFIELFRGVPLVTLLLMGQFVVPLFFPNTVEPPSGLTRAIIAVTMFEAAYVAEVVRGGLQAVAKGQHEAAMALGLGPWATMRRIVMPQALRNVLPAMVGQFISLFKDTSLLAVLGYLELLRVVQTTVNQPEFLGRGLHTVAYAFVALIYWAVSYSMSRESRRLERRLGVGER
ncbi:MAG: amino acid ABC transporter permease [Acidimicrobiales bacterium]